MIRLFSQARGGGRLVSWHLLALFLAAAGAAGCSDGGEGRADEVATTVDTVDGVVRVTHSGAPPVVGLEEVLALGSGASLYDEESPEEFGRVTSVVGGPDGSVYVGDGIAKAVRSFAADGSFLRSLTRTGAGPGELEAVQSLGWIGDTIVVMDNSNARLTLLATDGEYAGQWPYMRLSGTGVRLYPTGPGEVYAQAYRVVRTGSERDAQSIWVRHTAAGPGDTLVIPRLEEPIPGTSQICRGMGQRGGWISAFQNPLGDALLTTPAPGGLVARAMKSAYEIAWTDAAGDTVRVLRVVVEPRPTTDSAWSEAAADYDEWWAEWRDGDCTGGIRRPATVPILEALYHDHDGRLVTEVRTPEGRALDVFDHDQRWLARIPLPERDDRVPPYLRGDRLLLVARDSMEVQTVHALRMTDRP